MITESLDGLVVNRADLLITLGPAAIVYGEEQRPNDLSGAFARSLAQHRRLLCGQSGHSRQMRNFVRIRGKSVVEGGERSFAATMGQYDAASDSRHWAATALPFLRNERQSRNFRQQASREAALHLRIAIILRREPITDDRADWAMLPSRGEAFFAFG